MLIASLVLCQVKEVGAVTQKEINYECRTLAYISLVWTILGLAMVAVWHYRKLKYCTGHTFANAVKIMGFQMFKIIYLSNCAKQQVAYIYRHAKSQKHKTKQ